MTGSQGQDTSEALAAAIRQAVRIHHIGPNSTSVIENGGSVLLTPQEADEAAADMHDWFQRALAAERERVLQEAADELPKMSHWGCRKWLRDRAAIARGNPHTEEEV